MPRTRGFEGIILTTNSKQICMPRTRGFEVTLTSRNDSESVCRVENKKILETIFGVDIMEDNVKECRGRLLKIAGDTKKNRSILKKNIVCADGLTYDYEFK